MSTEPERATGGAGGSTVLYRVEALERWREGVEREGVAKTLAIMEERQRVAAESERQRERNLRDLDQRLEVVERDLTGRRAVGISRSTQLGYLAVGVTLIGVIIALVTLLLGSA